MSEDRYADLRPAHHPECDCECHYVDPEPCGECRPEMEADGAYPTKAQQQAALSTVLRAGEKALRQMPAWSFKSRRPRDCSCHSAKCDPSCAPCSVARNERRATKLVHDAAKTEALS